MLKKKDVKNEKEGCEKRQRIEMGSKNRKQTGRDNQLCYLQTPEVWQLKDQPQKKVQFNRPTTKTTKQQEVQKKKENSKRSYKKNNRHNDDTQTNSPSSFFSESGMRS